jgi:hypothetical protein
MCFDDSISALVLAQELYANREGQRDTTNVTDGIYRDGGDQLLVALAETDQGYSGTFNIGLDLSNVETGAADGFGPGGGPPPDGTQQPGG